MITFSLNCKSKHWTTRLKKIDLLIKKILKFKKDLKFKNHINYNCNIILADNHFTKKLNLKYRKQNRSTDVLTFISEIKIKNMKTNKLCDIFLSAEMIKKDANKNGINFYDHLTHLCIHSFLHINGFMHYNLHDFNKMKKIEIIILNKMGISNPYLYR